MVRHVMTRSQRRVEKKQAVILLVLALAVSLVSFTLGVMVGRSGSRPAPAAAPAPPVRLPVAQAVPALPTAEKPTESLTFYDSLPKGEQPPLGSGINLPPQKETAPAAVAVAEKPAPPEPVKTPAPARTETSAAVPAKAAPPASAAVPAPAPAKAAASAAKAASAGGAYVVQAAAFRRSDDARSLQARLGKKGYAAFTQEATLEAKGTWYRVYVGPFATSGAAEAAVARLKAEEKLSAMVRKR